MSYECKFKDRRAFHGSKTNMREKEIDVDDKKNDMFDSIQIIFSLTKHRKRFFSEITRVL